MTSFSVIELVLVVVTGLFVLACAAALFYGIWLLTKAMKKLDRLDKVEADLKSMQEELRSLKGDYPPAA